VKPTCITPRAGRLCISETAPLSLLKTQSHRLPLLVLSAEEYDSIGPMDYSIERAQRRVYTDHQLHLAVLQLVSCAHPSLHRACHDELLS
jgi:hypothetical protein